MSGDTKPNHWVRRRGYSKVHVKSWTIYLEKNGYVKCPFQNCNFMAFDVEEMYQHYSICNGDSSFAKFVCSICQGRTVTAEKLRNHKLKAHDVSDVDITDFCDVDDENSNDDANDSTIKKAALSKVVILSWKCSLEENKYIKCPECDYLEKDVSAMVNHYVDCKKDSVIACYVCPECKGKAISLDILQCHMSYAHKVDTNKLNFNKISPRMVQIWYDEIAHNKFARCLHKCRGVVDCLYFDTGISGIILHYQTCNGPDSSIGTRHTCVHCKHWTDCEEKLQVHIELCHVSPLVSRCSDIATRHSRSIEINSCCRSKTAHKDFKVKIPFKDKYVKVDTASRVIVKEEEEYLSCEEETSIMRDSMGYNLFDEVIDVAESTDGKADVDEFTINSSKDKLTVQPDIDLPSDIAESTSAAYCLNKDEDTFLHSDLMASPVLFEQTSRYSDASSAVCEENVETVSGVHEDVTKTVKNKVCAEGNRRGLSNSPKGSISKPLKSTENIKRPVDLNKLNQNVKASDASVETVVSSEAAEVSNSEASFRADETLSINILNNDVNSSNKNDSQQDSFEHVNKLSVGITDAMKQESDTEKNEETNTVCSYVVEVCKEDENKDVLCFKITDLEEPRSSIEPVEGENVLHCDVTQSSKPDISFQSDDGSVKNVYVLSTELADTNTQSMTDESNKTVSDPSKLCASGNDSVSCKTQEYIGLVASAAGTSGSQDDKDSPRIVQFFKKGRLSIPPSEKNKVVCIQYRKDTFFRNRLARARCKPAFDDRKPSCSGVEVETKPESCLRQMKVSSNNLVTGIEGKTKADKFQTTNCVDTSVNTSEPSLVSKEELSETETVRDNTKHILKNDDSGSIKTDFIVTVESSEDSRQKCEQQSELNVSALGRVEGSKETVVDIDSRHIEALCENSNKDVNVDCQNDSDLDKMKASQGNELDDSSVINSKCSDLESIVSDNGDIDNKKENNLFVKEAFVADETNSTEIVNEEKLKISSEECSDDKNNKEKITADVRILESNEGNVKKCMKNVGVRVRLGVNIEEMSAAKLRKMKRPIKNLVRKFCKEELRKYASAKKYFHSKKPTKNVVKKMKTENAEECQTVEEEIVEEESSQNIQQTFECEDESHRSFLVVKSNNQKPDDCNEDETLKRDDSENILLPAQENEMRAVASSNQLIIENTSQNNLSKEIKCADENEGNVTGETITSESSESIATTGVQAAECETEPLNIVSAEEPNRSRTEEKKETETEKSAEEPSRSKTEEKKETETEKLRKRKKGKLTNHKDADIIQDTVRIVDECLNKDELKKDLRPAEISELPKEQESSISKNIGPKDVNKPVSDKVKSTIGDGENNGDVVTEEVKAKSPKKYLIKKVNVEEHGCRSSVDEVKENIQLAGQDKTKCDDVNTLNLARKVECFDCEDGVVLPRTVAKTELVNNNKKEEILKDTISSEDIEEPEMSLVRKVKYVDELEANYSSKKLIVSDGEKEILIVLTEDVDCEIGTEEIERTCDNINNDKIEESSDSTKNNDSSKLVQTVSTDERIHNDSEKAMNANNVNTSNSVPVKRKRGRPSKQELLQRKLNESGNATGASPNVTSDLSSHVIDAASSSTLNVSSRVRRRTSISKRYLEDESPSVSSSERRRRTRNQPLWYMTPENSNDSTDSSQPASKRSRFSRGSEDDDKRTQSSNEDDDRSVDNSTCDERKHSNKIDSGTGETEINKEAVGQVEGERKTGEQSNLNDTGTSSEATPVKRKRGRPRKNFNNINDLSQNSSLDKPTVSQISKASVDSGDDDDNADNDTVGADSESESSKRRSAIKAKAFSKIQPGEKVANSLQQADSEENCDDTSSWNEKVKCGRCGKEMIRRKYLREHRAKHYNLCWLDGEEPIDFANQDEVCRILFKLQNKSSVKLSFKCETCGAVKKSAVGYQSHMVFCGKSMEEREALMEQCTLCGRVMMPSSLKVHMGAVHNNNKPIPVREEETVNFVRGKRAAASKAESALQDSLADNDDIEVTHKKRSRSPVDDGTRQLYKRSLKVHPYQLSKWRKIIAETGFASCHFPMCSFKTDDVETLREHAKTCPQAPPKVYSCRQCDFETGDEQEMIMHVRTKHEDSLTVSCPPSEESSSESEESHDSNQTSSSSLVKKHPKLKFIRKLAKLHGYRFFHHALRWTYEMREENYSKDVLFNALKPRLSEWTNMDEDKVELYLPKTRTSIRLVTENEEWRQIQLFESDFIDGALTLFAGGPVWAAAWAPVPDKESRQYLAVSCHPDMDLEHAMGRMYTYKNLIQIWKFDQLDNMKTEISKPKMIYGIAHDHGAVWSLEWCPSGCYQDDRIGIVAAACSDGYIYIYSVPREDADGSCKICKPKPSAVLNLGSEMVSQCTRLSWHKVSPHSVLAAGFASGMVGLWDLNTKSPLLRCDNVYYPYHVFQAHQSSVTGLSFGPSEEVRYLVTASVDCSNKFWDLRETVSPVTVQRRGCVTDSVWMQNWLCSVSAYDEVYGYAVTNITLNAYRDFYYQPCALTPQIGVTWSVSCNDWMNSIACADETGRVIVLLPSQVTYIDDKKAKRSSKVALLNTLHDFGKIQEVNLPLDNKQEKSDSVKEENEENSENHSENAETLLKYSEAVTRYGLSFKADSSGFGIEHARSKTVTSLSNPNVYPLTAITKVSWNPNFKSFMYLAAGYQCGIVVIPQTTYVRSADLIPFYRRYGSTN